MSEVGEFIRGRRFTWNDVVADGIPAVHYSEIYTTYDVAAYAAITEVSRVLAPRLRLARPGDVIIAAVGETVEDLAKAVAWLGSGPVAIHDDTLAYRSELDPKYVAYYMQSRVFQDQKVKHVARAKVKRISAVGLGRILIPLPSQADQRKIVAVMEKFEGLLTDISIAISAEINARRKQHDHYRDRLLSFKPVVA